MFDKLTLYKGISEEYILTMARVSSKIIRKGEVSRYDSPRLKRSV